MGMEPTWRKSGQTEDDYLLESVSPPECAPDAYALPVRYPVLIHDARSFHVEG
jgi:hypothetical protein